MIQHVANQLLNGLYVIAFIGGFIAVLLELKNKIKRG